MKIFESLFRLVVEKVPEAVAHTLLAVLLFVFRPYRTALQLTTFARRKHLAAPTFVAIAFILFTLLPSYLTFTFSGKLHDLPQSLQFISKISTGEDKTGIFYIVLYSLSLTCMVMLGELLVESMTRKQRGLIFRDLYLIASALILPWSILFYVLLIFGTEIVAYLGFYQLSIEGDYTFIVLVACAMLAASPILVFATTVDRRWYRSSPVHHRLIRIAGIFLSVWISLLAMPTYLYYLTGALYPRLPKKVYAVCFLDRNNLYATITIDNPADEISKLDEIVLTFDAHTRDHQQMSYVVKLDRKTIFQEVKDGMILNSKDKLRLRVVFSVPASTWNLVDGMVYCSTQEEHDSKKIQPAAAHVVH